MSQDLQAEVAELRETVADLRETVADLERLVRPRAITTWREVAAILNLSEDTVARRRRERGDKTALPFRTRDGVWEWWHELQAPAAPARRRAPKPKRGPLDVKALVNELTGG